MWQLASPREMTQRRRSLRRCTYLVTKSNPTPGKNTGVGSHSLLQGNLPNPGIELASSVSPALQVAAFLTSLSPLLYQRLTESVSYMSSVNILTFHLILKLQKLQDILSFSISAGLISCLGVEQLILMKIHSKGFQPFEYQDE